MIVAAAAIVAAFNLVCSGTFESDSFYGGKKSEPYSYTYRIDLDAKKWCDRECKALFDIADIQPTTIVLEPPKDIDTPTQKEFRSGRIDRETGRHSMLATSGRRERIMILKWEGQCERAPFTGFPTFETRF